MKLGRPVQERKKYDAFFCNIWKDKNSGLLMIFNVILAIATSLLVVVACFQNETLDKTNKTLRVSERTAIVPNGFSAPYAVIENGQLGWIISLQLQNTGGSATEELRSHLRYRISDKDLGGGLTFDPDDGGWRLPLDGADISGIIGPKQNISANSLCIRDNLARQIRDKKKFMYLAGWLTYADTFTEHKIISQFCDQIIREVGAETYPNIRKHTGYGLPIAYRFCQNPALNCSGKGCNGNAADRLRNREPPLTPVRNHDFTSFCAGD